MSPARGGGPGATEQQLADLKELLQALTREAWTNIENKIGELDEHIHEEVAVRTSSEQAFRQMLEGWTCKEAREDLSRERLAREELDHNVRGLLAEVTEQEAKQQAALREVGKHLEDEVHRLWEAVDSHTHEVDGETNEDESVNADDRRSDSNVSSALPSTPITADQSGRSLPFGRAATEHSHARRPLDHHHKQGGAMRRTMTGTQIGSQLANLRAEIATARAPNGAIAGSTVPQFPTSTGGQQQAGSLRVGTPPGQSSAAPPPTSQTLAQRTAGSPSQPQTPRSNLSGSLAAAAKQSPSQSSLPKLSIEEPIR